MFFAVLWYILVSLAAFVKLKVPGLLNIFNKLNFAIFINFRYRFSKQTLIHHIAHVYRCLCSLRCSFVPARQFQSGNRQVAVISRSWPAVFQLPNATRLVFHAFLGLNWKVNCWPGLPCFALHSQEGPIAVSALVEVSSFRGFVLNFGPIRAMGGQGRGPLHKSQPPTGSPDGKNASFRWPLDVLPHHVDNCHFAPKLALKPVTAADFTPLRKRAKFELQSIMENSEK